MNHGLIRNTMTDLWKSLRTRSIDISRILKGWGAVHRFAANLTITLSKFGNLRTISQRRRRLKKVPPDRTPAFTVFNWFHLYVLIGADPWAWTLVPTPSDGQTIKTFKTNQPRKTSWNEARKSYPYHHKENFSFKVIVESKQ